MTAEEQMIIANFRKRGLGYKRIATLTGISINTIKAFCRRQGSDNIFAEDVSRSFCRGCGKAIESTPGKREKKWCSDSCRMKWWNSHPNQVQRKSYYSFICPQCGIQFESYGNDHRKFCSRNCLAQARRKKDDQNGC